MNDKLMEKLKKKGKKLDPLEKEAKMGVVKELSSQARELMGNKLKGLKKVTVASDSPAGLKAGLEKAEELVGKRDPEGMVEEAEEELGADLDHDNEEGESLEHKMKVLGDNKPMEDCSPEELDEKIQQLQKLKELKLAKNY